MKTGENISVELGSRWLGLTDYESALKKQHDYCDGIARSEDERSAGILLGFEHPEVITLGRRGGAKSEVLFAKPETPIIQTDRGGQATLHSPGQLVIYPVCRVSRFSGVRAFLGDLLKSLSQCLKEDFGCVTHEICGQPGLFTERGKIAFAGLRVDRGVSRHGLSININNDLTLFNQIQACGVRDAKLDRLSHYIETTPEQVFFKWCERFQNLTAPKNS